MLIDKDNMGWQVALLKCKLASSELRRENAELRATIREQNALLADANRLLVAQTPKPQRKHVSASDRAIVAGKQRYKCANPDGMCPLARLPPYDCSFDDSGFHLDHLTPFCDQPVGPLQATCVMCHGRKSIREAQERHCRTSQRKGE
jgi:hypothetical protein